MLDVKLSEDVEPAVRMTVFDRVGGTKQPQVHPTNVREGLFGTAIIEEAYQESVKSSGGPMFSVTLKGKNTQEENKIVFPFAQQPTAATTTTSGLIQPFAEKTNKNNRNSNKESFLYRSTDDQDNENMQQSNSYRNNGRMVNQVQSGSTHAKNNHPNKSNGRNNNRNGRSGGGGSNNNRGNQGSKAVKDEDLDADLDAYMASRGSK